MKILQICLKPPFPEVDGGCKAMHAITQGMLDGGLDVKVLTISTHKHPFLKESMSKSYIEQTQIEHRFIKTKVTPQGALVNLFSSKSYNLERFFSKDFDKLITQTLREKEYDIILLESFFVTGYIETIRKNSSAKIIYKAHNIEHDIWHLNAKKEKGIKKWYINFLANRLKTAEITNIKKVDGITPITNLDKYRFKELGCTVPMITIPFSVKLSDYQFKEPQVGSNVFHIGSMDWLPNITGINWLLENVWNGVVKQNPDAALKLAGRHMPASLKSDKLNNIEVVGEVDSTIDFINAHNIMVVPLLAGSGMRVKIIEGMALGKLVIATTIAAEGISYTNKENIVIANTPEEFTKAIIFYLEHTNLQVSIGKSARKLMEQAYDNKVIAGNLIQFFKKLTYK